MAAAADTPDVRMPVVQSSAYSSRIVLLFCLDLFDKPLQPPTNDRAQSIHPLRGNH